jgi:hypothetical protein
MLMDNIVGTTQTARVIKDHTVKMQDESSDKVSTDHVDNDVCQVMETGKEQK